MSLFENTYDLHMKYIKSMYFSCNSYVFAHVYIMYYVCISHVLLMYLSFSLGIQKHKKQSNT